jgi:hypothetical protein
MFGGIPTHFVNLANHPSLRVRDLSLLKVAWIGGSPVMRATYEQFVDSPGFEQIVTGNNRVYHARLSRVGR